MTFYDDNGLPVATTAAVYPGDELSEGDAARLRRQVVCRLTDFLVHRAANATQAGRRILILSYLMRLPSAPKTLKDLGRKLGITEAGACLAVKRFRAGLRGISQDSAGDL